MPPKKKAPVIKVKVYVQWVREMPKLKKMPVPCKCRPQPPPPLLSAFSPYHKKVDGVFDCRSCGVSQEFSKSQYGLSHNDGYADYY